MKLLKLWKTLLEVRMIYKFISFYPFTSAGQYIGGIKMKKFIIEEKDLNAILQYLATKPYQEVAQGIAALTKLEEIKD